MEKIRIELADGRIVYWTRPDLEDYIARLTSLKELHENHVRSLRRRIAYFIDRLAGEIDPLDVEECYDDRTF